jgi:hypothetical protein
MEAMTVFEETTAPIHRDDDDDDDEDDDDDDQVLTKYVSLQSVIIGT